MRYQWDKLCAYSRRVSLYSSFIFFNFEAQFSSTLITIPVAELHVCMIGDIWFNLFPISLVIPYFFAFCAYGKKPPKSLNLIFGKWQKCACSCNVICDRCKSRKTDSRVPVSHPLARVQIASKPVCGKPGAGANKTDHITRFCSVIWCHYGDGYKIEDEKTHLIPLEVIDNAEHQHQGGDYQRVADFTWKAVFHVIIPSNNCRNGNVCQKFLVPWMPPRSLQMHNWGHFFSYFMIILLSAIPSFSVCNSKRIKKAFNLIMPYFCYKKWKAGRDSHQWGSHREKIILIDKYIGMALVRHQKTV